jgi:hypothetical protein
MSVAIFETRGRKLKSLNRKQVIACSTPEGGVRVWNIDGDQGSKPLHTFHGHTDDIRCLAWYGVNVNTTDQVGITPLMTAAELGLEVKEYPKGMRDDFQTHWWLPCSVSALDQNILVFSGP